MAKCKATAAEAASLEKLLERKSGDLRRGVITFLSQQADEVALGSANRLLDSTSHLQAVAGLELMRELLQSKRCVAEIRARAEKYRAAHPTLNDAERQQLETILAEDTEVPTLQNALGLIRHEEPHLA